MDEDIDWRAIEGAPDDHGPIEGRQALRAYVADWDETFENLANVPLEIVDAGGDTVVSVQCASGTARLSGVPTELVYGMVYTLREGRIVRAREYATREEAFATAGVAVPD
jgi:ketosteroid isomerase-like protein